MSAYSAAHRIDPAAAWDNLPPDAQRALGIAALTTMISAMAGDDLDEFVAAVEAAEARGFEEMESVVMEHLARGDGALQVIDTATLGFPSCRICGCVEDRACEGGCGWANAARDLCTVCAPLRCEAVNG